MMQQTSLPQAQDDPTLMAFLKDTVSSFVRWDLIRFFNDNPHSVETAENIARYTGREVRSVESELNGLVDSRVLRTQKVGERSIFSLSPDAAVRDLVRRFVLACDDPKFRMRAINQVIRRDTH